VRRTIAQIAALSRMWVGQSRSLGAAEPWGLRALVGRLVELSGGGPQAVLTCALRLVVEAQGEGEPAAWVTGRGASFFPPDALDLGVDLDALPVIRVADEAVARAAEVLLRSGAFGLSVLDLSALGARVAVPPPLQSRLLGLAQKHDAAILCLTDKPRDAPSLGSLVSLRAEATRARHPEGGFRCTLTVIKDKRRAPDWSREERLRGPAGLR
jgi:recombination protein RecA